jgi:hypothetical protein
MWESRDSSPKAGKMPALNNSDIICSSFLSDELIEARADFFGCFYSKERPAEASLSQNSAEIYMKGLKIEIRGKIH